MEKVSHPCPTIGQASWEATLDFRRQHQTEWKRTEWWRRWNGALERDVQDRGNDVASFQDQ